MADIEIHLYTQTTDGGTQPEHQRINIFGLLWEAPGLRNSILESMSDADEDEVYKEMTSAQAAELFDSIPDRHIGWIPPDRMDKLKATQYPKLFSNLTSEETESAFEFLPAGAMDALPSPMVKTIWQHFQKDTLAVRGSMSDSDLDRVPPQENNDHYAFRPEKIVGLIKSRKDVADTANVLGSSPPEADDTAFFKYQMASLNPAETAQVFDKLPDWAIGALPYQGAHPNLSALSATQLAKSGGALTNNQLAGVPRSSIDGDALVGLLKDKDDLVRGATVTGAVDNPSASLKSSFTAMMNGDWVDTDGISAEDVKKIFNSLPDWCIPCIGQPKMFYLDDAQRLRINQIYHGLGIMSPIEDYSD